MDEMSESEPVTERREHTHNPFTCDPALDDDGQSTNPYCTGQCPTPEHFDWRFDADGPLSRDIASGLVDPEDSEPATEGVRDV